MANERRVLVDFARGTIGAITASGLTLTSTGLTKLPALASTDHFMLTLDPLGSGNGPEVVKVTAHSASATSATITRAAEQGAFTATAGVIHAAGTSWVMAAPRSTLPRFAFTAYTQSGNLTLNSGSWAAVLSGGGLDVSIPAKVDDVVVVQGHWLTNGAVFQFDAASMVSGSPVNYWGTAGGAGGGVVGWYGGNTFNQHGLPVAKRIVSGDLSAGTLTVRLYYKGGSGTFYTDSTTGWTAQFHALNLGPQPFVWG